MQGILSIQSHVVYGHAGNSSAVFPMQRMGFEVWPIHTVQFSNHTQYPQGWQGSVFPAHDIGTLIDGLEAIGQLKHCAAIVTGYQGSAAQCDAIEDTVRRIRQANPSVLYCCDPVMGSPEKGCIVADGVAEKLLSTLLPLADVIVPNQFELSQFADMPINSLAEAITACKIARQKGPKIVLVKHLHSLSATQFSMLLATASGCYLAQRPHLAFERQPVGVGDLISGLFTAGLLKGWTAEQAFLHCHNAVYGVLEQTLAQQAWELRTIQAQDEFIQPTHQFTLTQVD